MATFQILPDSVEKIRPKMQSNRGLNVRKRGMRVALEQINKNKIETKKPRILKPSEHDIYKEDASKKVEEKKKEIVVQVAKKRKEEEQEESDQLDCVDLVCADSKSETVLSAQEKLDDDLEEHAEYLRDIWSYMVEMEKTVQWPKTNYMRKQLHLTNSMRSILVDWLVSVADEYKLSDQTLHLSVNYIDRFLSQMSVVKEKFQLLGSAAMMLAGKVEDVYPPDSKEWAYLTSNSYTSQQVQRMEQLILKVLKFDLQPPTILAFIQQLCVEHKLDKRTMYLAMYFSELILLEGEDYLHYVPSKLAAGSIALARFTLAKRNPWPRKLESSSGYSLKQLSPVVQRQNRTFVDSPTKQQQAIQSKYQTDKYHKVALLSPKTLDLDESEDEF